MFDRINIQSNTEYVPYDKTVTVTEKKAPTDDSIKLLNEFEEKARKNIIAKINIDENYLKAVAVAHWVDIMHDQIIFYGKFTLNGKEYRIEEKINNYE